MSPVPLVSVITPAYNAARFVAAAIHSVQTQSFQDWEMIIADDSSSDATRQIVEEIAGTEPRLQLISQARRGGPGAARNAALEKARGRYICFLDSDDLWLPEKLEHQLAFAADKQAAISYCAYRRISEDGSTLGRVISVPASLTYRQLLRNTGIAMLTAMIDRSLTGPFRLSDAGHEDYILWLDLLKQGHRAYGLNEDLARYRVVKQSQSRDTLRSVGWVWNIYRNVENLGRLEAAWCLSHYALRAALKRL